MPVASLPSAVPSDVARYHFFLFKHTHEGDYMEKIGMYTLDHYLIFS